jgi:hypothetical protein
LNIEDFPELRNLGPLVSAAKVRKLRNCHKATVQRAHKAGLLVCHKVNSRTFLYTRESVLKWLGFEEEAK